MSANGKSLLQEIIIESTKENGDVPRMLRLCLVLASKLNHGPLKQWVRQELEGYSPETKVPEYRKFGCRNRGYFHTLTVHGTFDIPIYVLPKALQLGFQGVEIRQNVSECADLALTAKKTGDPMQVPWPTEFALVHASKAVNHGQCVRAWQEISPSAMEGMLDQIKTKVLEFALEIEKESPDVGEIASSSNGLTEEKVSHIYNTTINGSVQNYTAGSQNVTQNAGLVGEDLKALLISLRNAGIPDSDIDELETSLDAESLEDGGIKRIKEWYGALMIRYAVNAGSEFVHTLWDQAAALINTYLGS